MFRVKRLDKIVKAQAKTVLFVTSWNVAAENGFVNVYISPHVDNNGQFTGEYSVVSGSRGIHVNVHVIF